MALQLRAGRGLRRRAGCAGDVARQPPTAIQAREHGHGDRDVPADAPQVLRHVGGLTVEEEIGQHVRPPLREDALPRSHPAEVGSLLHELPPQLDDDTDLPDPDDALLQCPEDRRQSASRQHGVVDAAQCGARRQPASSGPGPGGATGSAAAQARTKG